jgi:hypothetical protein
VAEKWVDKVIEVRRVSERMMVVRVIVGKSTISLVSVYAPQVGRSREEKENFFTSLGEVLAGLDENERLFVCGDFNGHVGKEADGFEEEHGGNGFGDRNVEGELLLEFADAMKLVVSNTWFKKDDSKKVTYESGGCSTVVDYILVRKCDRKFVTDVKVIRSEECIPQHKLLVCAVKMKDRMTKRGEIFASRCRIWKLKEIDKQVLFLDKIRAGPALMKNGDVESAWKGLKDSLLKAANETCGRTKGPPRHNETWWWNDEVAKVVEEKRRLFRAWKRTGTEIDKTGYLLAKRSASRTIGQAQENERRKFGEKLEREAKNGNVFKITKQIVRKNRDVTGGGCVKDTDGKIVVDDEKIKELWRKYYEKLLNEEFDWDKNSLDTVNAVSGPCEQILAHEVRAAITKAKNGKAAGPSCVVSEMLKASGEVGVEWVTYVCNAVIKDGKIPADWKRSQIVNVFKGKGDALECGSYRGIKLLDHVMKVLERVIEKKVRSIVKIDDMQFGFRPGRSTTDAIFIVRQVQERFLAKKKDLWMAFVDLEKAFDRVPREVVWWALRKLGVHEWIVTVIISMYEGVTTAVKVYNGVSNDFEVKVGVHQGSVLSPLLFVIVLEALSCKFREGLPFELLYADDLALMAESEERLLESIKRWRGGMEEKGLRVNMGKTKVMKCQVSQGQADNSGKWPCGVCRKGVGTNSIFCVSCSKWIHRRCSGLKGKLREVPGYQCVRCVEGGARISVNVKKFNLGQGEELQFVDRFCYLGDMIGAGGGSEEASRVRVKCAWGKFRELGPILTSRGPSLKLKGKIYKACVQSVLIYGSETWAMKVEDTQRLERTERMMVRWMCGFTLRHRKSSEELNGRLGIECVSDVVRCGRLRWYGHVERMSDDDVVSTCRDMLVTGENSRGKG